jgi:hypothetical protein
MNNFNKPDRTFLTFVLSFLTFVFGLSFNAYADMGRVHVSNEAVAVSEDSQKAIILHNLEDEVLILGTDLKASKKTGIIRFIPFPSEPAINLAPENVFEKVSLMIKKYGLVFQNMYYTKSGSVSLTKKGVELLLNKKLGAHDMTLIKVNDVSTFRRWVNNFFKEKKLPLKESYPEEEAVVYDYVKRGIQYFVLDFVEVEQDIRFIEPVIYRFKSKKLYYPLKTSNTFGGEGGIELIIVATTTLCASVPGGAYSETVALYDKKIPCFDLPVRASTSAFLVKEEEDIKELYPGEESFFGDKKAFIQVITYRGKYYFKEDIFVDVSMGLPKEVRAFEAEQSNPYLSGLEKLSDELFQKEKICSLKSERGPCKGNFRRYQYDPLSKDCKEFIWGGCGGTVPFETKEECIQQCLDGIINK